jgi:hypothetical protein
MDPGSMSAIKLKLVGKRLEFPTEETLPGPTHDDGAAVLDRIVDEICDGIEQEIPICDNKYGFSMVDDFDLCALGLRGRIEQFGDISSDLEQVDRAKASVRLAASICEMRVSEENMRRTSSMSSMVVWIKGSS